jgi:O-antigen/teichoic acid export membrane protein
VHLGAEQLGLWAVVLASTSVARLSDLGLTGSVVKFVARYRALNDEAQAANVVQTAAISIAVVMAVLILAIYPLLDNVLMLAVPEQSMPQAKSILPWALFSLWLVSVGGVFQSGLDGCQRMDIRNSLMIIGNVLFLGASLWLVPNYDLVGLAIGQAAQALFLALTSWAMLRRQIPSLPFLPIHWSKEKFKEIFNYAVNFQINSIAILLFDPLTKLLMSRYGGLSSAAFYEMASQLVVKLRALVISATQSLTPAVAELHERSPEHVRALYIKAYKIVFFATIPLFAAILISLPIVSVLWIGHIERQFLVFGVFLVIGWGMNTLMGPAYFFNLGTGDLKWNSIAHVAMAALNVLLGLYLGEHFGGEGVAFGTLTSLVIASWLVLIALHVRYNISFSMLLPKDHIGILVAALLSISFAALMFTSDQLDGDTTQQFIVCAAVYLFVIGVVMRKYSYRKLFAIDTPKQENIS